MSSTVRVLLLEDNPGDVRLFREGLREISNISVELIHVETLAVALELVRAGEFDVGLLDLALPDARGLEVVQQLHDAAPDVPLVVLTALKDDALAIQALQNGAQDYLVKSEIHGVSLWRALRYAMERHHRQLALLSLSFVDDLTGLSNRKGFLTLASQHARLAYRSEKSFLVGFIDLDGLKEINDTFGHREGNHALVETATVLRDSFRQSDILARYGGDEFAVVVSDAPSTSGELVIQRIQDKVAARNAERGRPYRLSLSVGIVASDPASALDIEQLLHQADALMYQQKRNRQALRETPRV